MHFVLVAALVFAWHGFTAGREPAAPPPEIVVTKGQIARLGVLFAKTWQRPPRPEELEGLIEDHVREEVYYREARAMGLDRDDMIVRRRMRQKLEFVTEDVTGDVEPTDAELRAYLEAHPDAFRTEPVLSFRHVYFSPDRRESVERDARAALARLREGAASTDGGDTLLMLEPAFVDEPLREIERALGRDFAAKLLDLPVGEWSGPVRSGFGLHLVFVEKRTGGEAARLEDVRDAVAREWGETRRRELRDQFYRSLRSKYVVTVERDD